MPALLLLLALATPSQDTKKPPYTKADRIKHLEDEIASLEQTLAAARDELRALKSAPKRVNVSLLRVADLRVGHVGEFNLRAFATEEFEVAQVLGLKELLVARVKRPSERFIVKIPSTAGMAEGRRSYMFGWWEVLGTRKVGERTYYVVEGTKDVPPEPKMDK